MSDSSCSFPTCLRAMRSGGLCHAHYEQRRRGKELSPLVAHALTPDQRFWAKVDKTDECWLWIGTTTRGYGHIWRDGRLQKAHRVSYQMAYGYLDSAMEIDHMCHNRGCVNPVHLQAVTKSLNQQNRSGPTRNNISGQRGVKWNKARRKWEVSVRDTVKNHYGGLYTDLAEASKAARELRLKLHTNNLLDRKAS